MIDIVDAVAVKLSRIESGLLSVLESKKLWEKVGQINKCNLN